MNSATDLAMNSMWPHFPRAVNDGIGVRACDTDAALMSETQKIQLCWLLGEYDSYKEQISNLHVRIHQLNIENKTWRLKHTEGNIQYDHLCDENAWLRRERERTSEQNQKQIRQFEREAETQHKLIEKRTNENAEHTATIQKYIRENRALNEQLAQTQSNGLHSQERHGQIRDDVTDRLSRVTEERDQAWADIIHLKEKLDAADDMLAQLNKKLVELHRSNQTEKVAAQRHLAEVTQRLGQQQEAAQQMRLESNTVKRSLSELTARNENLTQQLAKLSSESERLLTGTHLPQRSQENEHVTNYEQLIGQYEEIRAKYHLLLQQTDETHKGGVGELQRQQQHAMDRLTEERDQARSELTRVKESHQEEIEKREKLFSAQLKELRDRYEGDTEQLQRQEVEARDRLTEEREKARSELETVKKSHQEEIERKAEQFNRQLQELRDRLEGNVKELQRHQQQVIDRLPVEMDQSRAELERVKESHQDEIEMRKKHYSTLLKEQEDRNEDEVEKLQVEARDRLTEEREKARSELETVKKSHQEEIERKAEQFNRQLQELQDRKDTEVNKLTLQLSKYMNQKLGEDETALENINSKHRPSKIVEDYTELMTGQWLDAKDQLDKAFPDESMEEAKLRCLSNIMLRAGEAAEALLRQHRAFLQHVLSNPLTCVLQHDSTECKEGLDDFDELLLGSDLKSALTNFLKTCSDRVSLNAMVQELERRVADEPTLMATPRIAQRQSADAIDTYISAVCSIAWRMAVQRPPITLDTPNMGEPVDNKIHEVYFSCPKHDSNVISTYVWPMLKQKEKNLLKVKVYVVPEGQYSREVGTSQ